MEEMEIQSQDGLRPGENSEGKESESLNDATFEPGSLVEQTGDFQQSEAIQTNLSEVINNAVNQTTEQSGTSGVKGPGGDGVAVTPINLPREANVATGGVHGGGGDGVAITPINLPGGADVAIGGVHGGGGDGVAITPINLPGGADVATGGVHGGGGDGVAITPINLPGGANVANGEIHGPGGDGVASPNIPGGANVATSGVKGPGGDGVAEGVRVPGGGDPAAMHGSAPVTPERASIL